MKPCEGIGERGAINIDYSPLSTAINIDYSPLPTPLGVAFEWRNLLSCHYDSNIQGSPQT